MLNWLVPTYLITVHNGELEEEGQKTWRQEINPRLHTVQSWHLGKISEETRNITKYIGKYLGR